jgi:hypothetical protein
VCGTTWYGIKEGQESLLSALKIHSSEPWGEVVGRTLEVTVKTLLKRPTGSWGWEQESASEAQLCLCQRVFRKGHIEVRALGTSTKPNKIRPPVTFPAGA